MDSRWADDKDETLNNIIKENCTQTDLSEANWAVSTHTSRDPIWISVTSKCAKHPEQGWKLHVSAFSSSSQEVLRRALPVLLAEKVSFKVARSPQAVRYLNEGFGQESQIGKYHFDRALSSLD